MRVSELMSRTVATVGVSESAHAALSRMVVRKVRHLPVVDAHGMLVGIVTDRDLRHYLFLPGVFGGIRGICADTLLRRITVNEVMSAPAISIAPEVNLEAAVRLMVRNRIGSLPVVENGRVVGIITETDLLRRIVETEACSPECEAVVVSFP